jgi:tetratricopeptide (TPR) repeat protein
MNEFASEVEVGLGSGLVDELETGVGNGPDHSDDHYSEAGVVAASSSASAALLCECGSGLQAAVCCSLDLTHQKYAEPSPENRERLAALTVARKAADRSAAAAISIAILTEQPTLLEALSALFLIRRSEGNRSAARALIERLTTLVPYESRYSTYLVDGLMDDKKWVEAEAAARKVVRQVPGDARAHDTLGLVLSLQMKLPEGEFHLRRALALGERRAPRLLIHLGNNLQMQGQTDEARALFEEVHEGQPNLLEAMLALVNLEQRAGNGERAAEWLTQLEESSAGAVEVERLKAQLAYDRGEFAATQEILETAFPVQKNRPHADSYSLGQALDKLGRYDEAFACFDAANATQLNLAGQHFDLKAPTGIAQATRNFLSERALTFLPRAAVAAGAAQPLFIVGFGRSGTTMLEQSLSMHPSIMAGGELPGMARTAAVSPRLLGSPLSYPFSLSELWLGDQYDQIGLLRDHYLNAAQRSLQKDTKQAAAWFTDKALSQEQYLGLIHLLFPQSPIIHLVRHPLDVVVSGYANALPHGGYKGGVEELARFYLLLLESAEHFRTMIPALRCMQVKYEDMLDDQEHWTRTILDFVGEPFDAACLNFHENRRFARTLSYQQVREKLNAKSKYRYKRYLQHLGPAIEVLEPLITRLGYSI